MDSANQTRRDESIALLKKAIEWDPNFIEAQIYLAKAYMVRSPVGQWTFVRRLESAAEAESAVNKALVLDGDRAEVHLVSGKVHAFKYRYLYDATSRPSP